MSGYAFSNALTYEAETWHEGRGQLAEGCGQLFEVTLKRSKVIQGSNRLEMPNGAEIWYTGRGQAPEVCGQLFEVPPKVKGHPEVKLLRNALWPPNLVGRTPDRNMKHCRGQRSRRGHPGSTRVIQGSNHLNIALGPPNLVTRTPDRNMKHCWVKGHAGIIRGQSEVNLLRNALLPPNLVGRTPDRIIIHCRGQRSSRSHPGSTRGQLA